MAGDGLFDGLPPPAAPAKREESPPPPPPPPPPQVNPPRPAAKSALKRSAPDSQNEGPRQVRFKAGTETSKEKLIEAMQKIAGHIANPAKFSKASKVALQLLAAGSLSKDTSDVFFRVLEAAMSPPTKSNEAAVRADYHALFSAVQEHIDCFNPVQQEQIDVWLLWAQLANDFYTDDTFVFSKAAGRLRQAISSLPEVVADEELDTNKTALPASADIKRDESQSETVTAGPETTTTGGEVDPFGLDALLPEKSKKEDKCKKKKEEGCGLTNLRRQRRDALVECLTIATKRYKLQWAQTIVDITMKHAVDHINRFDAAQRERIEKLSLSVKEQHVKRKQGKSSSGKLDVTSFERYREFYATEKISIRKAVGAQGDRSAEQWLG